MKTKINDPENKYLNTNNEQQEVFFKNAYFSNKKNCQTITNKGQASQVL